MNDAALLGQGLDAGEPDQDDADATQSPAQPTDLDGHVHDFADSGIADGQIRDVPDAGQNDGGVEQSECGNGLVERDEV